jgi:hypothetical protein
MFNKNFRDIGFFRDRRKQEAKVFLGLRKPYLGGSRNLTE